MVWCSNSLSFAISTPEIECAQHLCPTLLLLSLRLNTKVTKCDPEECLFPSPSTFVLGNQGYETERKGHPPHDQDLHLACCLVLKLQAEERLHREQAQHVVKAVTRCPGKLCLSSSLPQNFCVVLENFLKPTLSEVMTGWVLLVLRMCGWRFHVWREAGLSSHSRSWGNTHWALETESLVSNKLRNEVPRSTKK